MKFSKGHNSVNSVGGVEALVLSTLSGGVLYLYQVFVEVSHRVSELDLNSRVDARVVANVDGRT